MKQSRRTNAILTRLLGVALAFVCVFAFIPTAHAEEARVNITANPSELTDSGNVTFTFEIANYNADYPMSDVGITYNGKLYDVLHGAQIPPSGSARVIFSSVRMPSFTWSGFTQPSSSLIPLASFFSVAFWTKPSTSAT